MNSVSNSKIFIFIFLWLSISPTLNSGLSRTESISRVIEEIQNREFTVAEQFILEISNYTEAIPDIVRTVYSGREENADLILGFSKATTKISVSLISVTALRNEMKKYGHRNPYKLMALAKNLESEVYYQSTGSDKDKARIVIHEIMLESKNSVKEILKSFMISNNFQNNIAVRNLSDTIFEFDSGISDEVMNELVNEMIANISAVRIADNIMHGCSKTPQIASALSNLFWKLHHNNDMNNQAVLRIANYISKLISRENYERTSKKQKYAVNMLIDNLPICARNLNFAKEVCIRNRGREEYIFASQTQFYNKRRAVFTCGIDQITDDGAWKIVQTDNKVYFRNQAQKKEILYASRYERYDFEKRHVQTWSEEGSLPKSSAWSIELNGDYCYIKNDHFNEFLYASDIIHVDRSRYIFTGKVGMSRGENLDFQWQIENCS